MIVLWCHESHAVRFHEKMNRLNSTGTDTNRGELALIHVTGMREKWVHTVSCIMAKVTKAGIKVKFDMLPCTVTYPFYHFVIISQVNCSTQ